MAKRLKRAQHVGLTKTASEIMAKIRAKVGNVDGEKIYIGVSDPVTATYGSYLEYGTAQVVTPAQSRWFMRQSIYMSVGQVIRNPPRPFLRGTANAKAETWAAVYRAQLLRLGSDPDRFAKALLLVGEVAKADVKETIATASTGIVDFARRSPITLELMREKYGDVTDQPLHVTGRLLRSIVFWKE